MGPGSIGIDACKLHCCRSQKGNRCLIVRPPQNALKCAYRLANVVIVEGLIYDSKTGHSSEKLPMLRLMGRIDAEHRWHDDVHFALPWVWMFRRRLTISATVPR